MSMCITKGNEAGAGKFFAFQFACSCSFLLFYYVGILMGIT